MKIGESKLYKIDSQFYLQKEMSDKKIFPIKLSKDFHGKPRQKMPNIHRRKLQAFQNPEVSYAIPSRWQKKSIDADIIKQRKQMVISSSKVSPQAPEWTKNTYHYFFRNNKQPKEQTTWMDQAKYDVLNQRRKSKYDLQENSITRRAKNEIGTPSSQFSQSSSYMSTRGHRNSSFMPGYSGSRFNSLDIDNDRVTGKVGSQDRRDYSIRKPLLKVGQSTYVDTYSAFVI